MQNSCITNDNNQNNQQNHNYHGLNILQKSTKDIFSKNDYLLHQNLDEKQVELKMDTATDQDDNTNPKINNQIPEAKISEASERTPMKDHYTKSRMENLDSSDGKENIVIPERRSGFNEYLGRENKEYLNSDLKQKSALKLAE